MRTDDQTLNTCPTCGGKVEGLGLRDYSGWLFDKLPNKVGATDFDLVLDQARTGRCLIMEFKPKGAWVPTGQKITLKNMVGRGCDVWVVWEWKDGTVEVGPMDAKGGILVVETTDKAGLAEKVNAWWREGFDDG